MVLGKKVVIDQEKVNVPYWCIHHRTIISLRWFFCIPTTYVLRAEIKKNLQNYAPYLDGWSSFITSIHTSCLTILNPCLLGNFSRFLCRLLIFFKIDFFKKFFQEYNQSVKQFGSRSGPTFRRAWSGSKLFAKFIGRRHWPAAGK